MDCATATALEAVTLMAIAALTASAVGMIRVLKRWLKEQNSNENPDCVK